MQLMIDTMADSVTLLRRAAKFLTEEADIRDQEEHGFEPLKPIAPQAPALDTAAVGFGKPAPAPLAPLPPVGLDVSTGSTAQIPQEAPLPPAAPANLELDASGLPWDERIHQATRGKKVDNTWKLKKGLDPAIAASVTAELRVGFPAPAAAAPIVQPTAPASPANPMAPPPPAQQVAPPPPADPIPAGVTQQVPPSAEVTDFRKLMQKITTATNAGKITNVQVDAALQSVGLPARQLVSLVQNPHLVGGVDAYIDACLAAAA